MTHTDVTPEPLVPEGTFAFDDDFALVIDRALSNEKVRRRALSPSTMNSLAGTSCAARWAADKILPREPDPFSPAEIGTLGHAVLEDFYALEPDERSPERAAMLAMKHVQRVKFTDRDTSDLTEEELALKRSMLLTDVTLAYRGIFDIEQPEDVRVHSLEMKLDGVEVAGVPILGYIDRVSYTPDGALQIIDYKSGKFKKAGGFYGDDHGDQMRVYALGMTELVGQDVREARLHYTKEGRSRRVATSAGYLAKTRKKVVEAWDRHNDYTDTGRYPTQVGALCGWCPLVNICPAAKAEGKTPRIAAPSPTELGASIPLRRGLESKKARKKPTQGNDRPHEQVPAHSEGDNRNTSDGMGDKNMARTTWPEDKLWVETVEGRLNPGSAASIATIGLTSTAVRFLVRAGQPVRPSTVRGVVSVLATVIARATDDLADMPAPDWQSGLNTRLRGALIGVIEEVHPLPFEVEDGDAVRPATNGEWEAWIDRVTRNVTTIVRIGEELYDGHIGPGGYAVFSGEQVAEEPSEDDSDEDGRTDADEEGIAQGSAEDSSDEGYSDDEEDDDEEDEDPVGEDYGDSFEDFDYDDHDYF